MAEVQEQDAEPLDEDLAVGLPVARRPQRNAARADHERADATLDVDVAIRRQRRESLVVVVMARENDVGARTLEDVPELLVDRA